MLEFDQLLETIKKHPTHEYANEFLGYEFKAKKSPCPVCGSKDNATYSPKLNICKCHGCEVGGNIIDLTMKIYQLEFIPALKLIVQNLNLDYNFDDNETTVETKEEIEQRKKEFAKREKLRKEKEEKEAKELAIAQNKAIAKFTKDATVFSKELDEDDTFSYATELCSMFPHQTNVFDAWRSTYLGYDTHHQTFTILNRLLDGTTYNIKHKEKFLWDEKENKHLNTRVDGKWISGYNSTISAFPLDYFYAMKEKTNTVFITEGEKDALNILSYGLNVLTLGGVASSWENHKNLLKDQIVYIWFDNDNAGYKNAIKRYNELKDIAQEVFIVLFFQIDQTLPNKYDISDFIADNKFANKDELLHKIAYSSSKLTTAVIQEIEDFTSLDLKEFYFNQTTTSFPDIKKSWLKEFDKENSVNITAKGEKDIKGLDDFLDDFKKVKNLNEFKEDTKLALLDRWIETDKYQNLNETKRKEKTQRLSTALLELIKNYDKIYKEYRQTHIVDMYEAFETLTRKTGYTLAKYDDNLAVWTGTHYHVIDERNEDFKGFLLRDWIKRAKIDKKKWTPRNINEIVEALHMKAVSLNSIHHYQKDKRVVNFTNGTLFISNKGKKTFIPHHDKKHGVMNMLEFQYNENATCPKWEKFLNKVLPNELDRQTLMEFIGYCFFPGHNYEAFLFLYGKTGANGKSVITDVIRSFFGEENISGLNIQQFTGHELRGLENKLVNIGTELDAKGLKDGQMGVLKALTSTNDAIQINPKFLDGYPLASRHQPKLINSGNAKPDPKVMDDGVYRRMLLLEFDYEIQDDEKIRDLSSRFTDELSGIMTLALKHLDNLVKRGKFTKSDRLLKGIEDYKNQTNPIRAFIKENLEEDQDIIIPKKLFYAFYKSWCEEKGLYVSSEPKFFQQIKENLKKTTDKKQLRVPQTHEFAELLGTQRPSWIQGVFIKSNDLISFMYKSKEILTSNLNRCKDTKRVIIKEDEENLKEAK